VEREAKRILQLTARQVRLAFSNKHQNEDFTTGGKKVSAMPAIAMMSSSRSLWFAAALSPLMRRTERH
jgi:hypothetical protein